MNDCDAAHRFESLEVKFEICCFWWVQVHQDLIYQLIPQIYKRVFCIKEPAPRPVFKPICIGLDDAGKSTLLSSLAGESTDDIQPTKGFVIKAIQFDDCILNVKEIGGGDTVRPFWKHYYQGADAVIFVVNSACSEDEMIKASDALSETLEHPALRRLPLLVIGNCQDLNGARNVSQVIWIEE
ncbi:hypothetical protein CAPTEDRAFT_132688 [Capitella teleta]|uniref:ADP-ribosylation factor-like protein 15 n=1 Tax=Capitella teleta TaxID=283909 RepID=R7TK61_CAPTE|nr:hypothetical protein CAPTEDRAFT_132688 [Capitella teleta]|eukprot:ELT93862.1 hypothetical protein CAPTEDRAFT_132688 [Capitella teleta]